LEDRHRLAQVEGQANTFRAENFDILYDSPVEASNFKELDFQVRGVPHRIIIDGEGNYDPERLRADVQKIVEAETTMFGGIPITTTRLFLHSAIEHRRWAGTLELNRARFQNGSGLRPKMATESSRSWSLMSSSIYGT